jgi:hypothetical protein
MTAYSHVRWPILAGGRGRDQERHTGCGSDAALPECILLVPKTYAVRHTILL